MRTVLHTESSHGHGGQEIRTLAEARWLLGHGWGVLIACQPDSPLLTEARSSQIPVEAVRMRSATDVGAIGRLRRIVRERGGSLVHTHSSVDSERFHGGVSGKPVRDELGLGDAPLVGLVANVRGSKGHSVFLEAARTVVAAVPDIRFLIVGDGVGFDEVRGRVRQMGLDARVTLTGFRRDIPEVMAALDVLVLPSIRSEAIPQVIPQALAVGTPVVASTIRGSPELIRDGENGRLVPPADPHALGPAVPALLRGPERARARARAGQAMVQSQYTIDVTMARTIAVYRDLLDASRTRELNI